MTKPPHPIPAPEGDRESVTASPEVLAATTDVLPSQYPGVDLAYPLAVASYDHAHQRIARIEGKLALLLGFVSGATALAPAVADQGRDPRSPWLLAAGVLFALAVVWGSRALLRGKLLDFAPEKLYNHWLHKDDWTFKRDCIYDAITVSKRHDALAESKWRAAVAVMSLFSAESLCLAAWAVGL